MEDRDTDKVRDTERTTIVHTDSDRGGGSGVLVALLVLVLLAVLLFFLFGGGLSGGGDEGDVNVNIEAPELTVPDIEVPDVNITLPETGGGDGNTANQAQ